MQQDTNYVPPLRVHALTGLYDSVLRATTRERRFKQSLLSQVKMPPNGALLDLGCGTGTMTLWARLDWPDARIFGVDADSRALAIARSKLDAADVTIDYQQGDAAALPIDDSSIDVVICSLFFHHLADEKKVAAVGEAARVLRPGGLFLIADWGRPRSMAMAVGFFLVRCLDGFARTRANAAGEIPKIVADGGFAVQEFDRVRTFFGEIQLLSCRDKS